MKVELVDLLKKYNVDLLNQAAERDEAIEKFLEKILSNDIN